MFRDISRIARKLLSKGPIGTMRWARFHLCEHSRERQLGVNTAAFAPGADRQNNECEQYEPTCYRCIEQALDELEIDPERDVFLDYGCGKGRAMTVAATYPFQKVIGVELADELAAAARENLARSAEHRRCGEVAVEVTDATAYSVPAEVTVIHLFNPFSGSVLEAVVQQIHRSWKTHPRPLTILYKIPGDHPDPFAACDWLKLHVEVPLDRCRWRHMQLFAYRSVADESRSTERLGNDV